MYSAPAIPYWTFDYVLAADSVVSNNTAVDIFSTPSLSGNRLYEFEFFGVGEKTSPDALHVFDIVSFPQQFVADSYCLYTSADTSLVDYRLLANTDTLISRSVGSSNTTCIARGVFTLAGGNTVVRVRHWLTSAVGTGTFRKNARFRARALT